MSSNIGKNIGTLRRKSGMTQERLAEEVDVSVDHIAHVEAGSNSISVALLLKLCKVLKVTPNDILAGEYEPEGSERHYLYDKSIQLKNVNSYDRLLLYELYQWMASRKRNQ